MVDMTELVPPKWWATTKRGWGMAITALTAMTPLVGPWLASLFGFSLTLEHIQAANAVVLQWLEATGYVIGFVLWVYGSFRPTAPLTLRRVESPVV